MLQVSAALSAPASYGQAPARTALVERVTPVRALYGPRIQPYEPALRAVCVHTGATPARPVLACPAPWAAQIDCC
jgi:hypothetical protein